MVNETENSDPAVQNDHGVKRRGLLRFGTLITALTGASAASAIAANSASAAPGDKNPSNTYVPLAEKGSPSGVATLDAAAKILPAQLPDLSTAILGQLGTDAANPTGILVTTVGSEIERPGSPANAALAKRDALNILDFGVVRGTNISQTAAIRAALDANTGKAFYFPPGDYRLDTELVIGRANSLILANGARLYAGAPMTTLITYFWNDIGYAEDKGITGNGWLLDGNLNAKRILSLGKVIRFTLSGGNFRDGINRGLVTEAGLGAELIASDLRFFNSGTTNVTDNIAIEANMGDSHFRDIIMRNCTVAVKDTSANRWNRVHPWISQDTQANPQMTCRYPTSIAFDLTGSSDVTECVSDTYRIAYKIRSNGTAFTSPPRMLNSRAMWAADPILPAALALANPAYVIDNSDGVGVISDRLTFAGHKGAPGTFLLGPTTNLDTSRTKAQGYIRGAQGNTADSMDYNGGIQQGTRTFTPTLYGSLGTGTHIYNFRSGRMVVNEDEVTYYVRINAALDSTIAFQGALRVGDIPLPLGATNLRDGAGVVGYAVNLQVASAMIFGSTAPYISIFAPPTTTGTSEVDVASQSLRGKVVDIMLRITATHFKS